MTTDKFTPAAQQGYSEGKEGRAALVVGPANATKEAVLRAAIAARRGVVRELPSYPDQKQLREIAQAPYDVYLVDVESDPDVAFAVLDVLKESTSSSLTAYSERLDPNLMLTCMRHGVSDVVTGSVTPKEMAETLERQEARTIVAPLPSEPRGLL